MDLEKCLENLKHDVNNGGLEDDSFAMNCYVTMANKARRMVKNGSSDPKSKVSAEEYLTICCKSGNDILKYIARA
jgi:hypothetical protein